MSEDIVRRVAKRLWFRYGLSAAVEGLANGGCQLELLRSECCGEISMQSLDGVDYQA